MKICLIAPPGPDEYCVALAKGLARRGHSVAVMRVKPGSWGTIAAVVRIAATRAQVLHLLGINRATLVSGFSVARIQSVPVIMEARSEAVPSGRLFRRAVQRAAGILVDTPEAEQGMFRLGARQDDVFVLPRNAEGDKLERIECVYEYALAERTIANQLTLEKQDDVVPV